eukprot:315956-Rhodomonas_salina.1
MGSTLSLEGGLLPCVQGLCRGSAHQFSCEILGRQLLSRSTDIWPTSAMYCRVQSALFAGVMCCVVGNSERVWAEMARRW